MALAPTASSAAVPVAKDPNAIACPIGPPGWSVPAAAGGKEIEDGETDVHYRPSDAVTVNCNYFTGGGKHILVYVQYALPADPNPINDFYYGCSSTVTPWNATDRVFRVTSRDQWAIAVFYDSLLQLKHSEVAVFESVTRRLLQNAEGYAHDCSLHVAPTPVASSYAFRFEVPAGHGAGSFLVQATPNVDPHASTVPVIQVQVPNIKLRVTTNGARYTTGHQGQARHQLPRLPLPRDTPVPKGGSNLSRDVRNQSCQFDGSFLPEGRDREVDSLDCTFGVARCMRATLPARASDRQHRVA